MTDPRPHPEPQLPDDDESAPMTVEERTVWVYLVSVAVTSGGYFVLVALRLLDQPANEVSWAVPLAVTLGLSVVGTIIGTMVAAVIGGVCREDLPASDIRDLEIQQRGARASTWVIGLGAGLGLILAMIDADSFWIGNVLFLFGALSAVVETTTKIRLYRRGF